MVKLVFRIIAFAILIVGFVMVMFGAHFVPDHKFDQAIRERKQIKIKLIGYIICGVSIVIFLIVSFF